MKVWEKVEQIKEIENDGEILLYTGDKKSQSEEGICEFIPEYTGRCEMRVF